MTAVVHVWVKLLVSRVDKVMGELLRLLMSWRSCWRFWQLGEVVEEVGEVVGGVGEIVGGVSEIVGGVGEVVGGVGETVVEVGEVVH